ncbi:4-hydroxybenzoate octaprenyltransferase [Magnetospirillum sp. UT-4]|uniref:4-hydroxybenzoate octaprenyltransferase n=1 Tax=Magnetospirillum sp. UT-4 TaxID=2681467 RepID=UPI0013808C22|nr:4-hydroxybenzoate octaprenyltransferase [Magnetospirillum sp. UT-4]CAA7623585.1 4-hydroxybenzoate octaprenyltransferase [Magnetospirillum sp. UT-4]
MSAAPTLHGDIPAGNWVDRHVPAPARPYLRLMRLDRPIGVWLLLLPCWWSLALAAEGWPDPVWALLFAIGAVVMRGAGCTINDIADREFDAKVERTKGRPIPSGAVSVVQALAFLALQLAVGLAVLLTFPPFAIWLGAASLLLVFPYPFMKRITWWPQAWLGLTFNWGALLGWAAVKGEIGAPALLLYAAGILWTLGYDTIYAHQDKDDDVLIGVKSTALRLGAASPRWLLGFYGGTLALLALAGWSAGLAWPFYPLLLAAGGHLLWQVASLDLDDGSDCLSKFKSNRDFGLLVLAALVAGRVLA